MTANVRTQQILKQHIEEAAVQVNQFIEELNEAPPQAKPTNTRKYQPNQALAAFIAGCLIAEDVIPFCIKGEDGFSDLNVAIRIITACLDNYSSKEDFASLPFEW